MAGEEIESLPDCSLLHFLPGLFLGLFHAVVVHFAHRFGSSIVFQVWPHRSQVHSNPSIGLVAMKGRISSILQVTAFFS
jgi:hypothetical protein